MKRRSLPVLELLGAHLAIKLIPTLLDAYNSMSVNQIFLAVDAQVVLTWLLTENVKTKTYLLEIDW